MKQTDQYLEVSNHEDDQDGDMVREVLRVAGGRLADGQIENVVAAILRPVRRPRRRFLRPKRRQPGTR